MNVNAKGVNQSEYFGNFSTDTVMTNDFISVNAKRFRKLSHVLCDIYNRVLDPFYPSQSLQFINRNEVCISYQ